MKKQLLIFAFAAMIIAPAMNAKSAMDSSLKCLWMNTDVASLQTDARQAVAKNGKFYLQNHTTGKIEVWDETGKIDEIATGNTTNIGLDDAGNILVRLTPAFPEAASTGSIRIISSDFSKSTDVALSGLVAGRADFFGHVSGNVLSADGGYMYLGGNWQANIVEIPIINGAQDVANTYQYNFASVCNSALKPEGAAAVSTTHQISAYGFMPNEIALLTPHYQKTNTAYGNGNSIYQMKLDEDGNWVPAGYYVTPNHNGCSGYEFFECNGNKYVVYSSGSNLADGFTIAKYTVKSTPANEDTDASARVATKYAEMKDDNSAVMYTNNAFYGNHFNVESAGENKVYIYQYCPKCYIAKYELDLSAYGPTTVKGDVNGDGVVNSSDLAALVNLTLNESTDSKGDVNGDGKVDASDISALITIILR